MDFETTDIGWMDYALIQAEKSAVVGEVPVGAVLTDGQTLLAAAGNTPIKDSDPTAHAEIKVIRTASTELNNYRLVGTTLYVTLEPCLMCMGAIIHSRIDRLVFGAYDPKTGAAVSKYQIGTDLRLNHTLQVSGGLLEDRCGQLLKDFFMQRRP
jgi:tRNA(adenine34) deaminase